jgi:predicted DNA-binding protein
MATGNQHTYDPMGKTFGVRIPDELRARLDTDAQAARMPKADVIRAALEYYLPILEATLPAQKRKRP